MNDIPALLRGRPLRYVLTDTIWERGPSTVRDLAARVDELGVVLPGRPSKVISDGLRWEIARGRVLRLGRGRYGPGAMPRQTRAWIQVRAQAIAEQQSERAGISLGKTDLVP